MLNIVNVGYDSTNYYIIESATALLLVDTGLPGTMPKLRHAMKRSDIDLTSVSHLLITHYHPDHAGLVQELKQLGVKLIVVDLQQSFIPLLKGYFKPQHGYVDISIDGNQNISLGQSRGFLKKLDLPGEIVASPGHTDDSVSLVLDTGAAFVGDLPRPEFATTNAASEEVNRSWVNIRAKSGRLVYPGHGPMYPLLAD